MHEAPQHLLLAMPPNATVAHAPDAHLLRWGRRFTPLVDVLHDDHTKDITVHLDCTGCGHLFGDEATMARRVLNALQEDFDRSTEVRAVLAPNATAARTLLASNDDRSFHDGLAVIEAHDLERVLDPLPIGALIRDAHVFERLHEVGIDTIGQLRRLTGSARIDCLTRHGPALLQHVDALLGDVLEPSPQDRPPPERCEAVQYFDGPLRCTQTIALAVHGLLEQLTQRLKNELHGVEILQVRLERPRQDDLVHTVRFTAPTRDAEHLRRVLAPALERMDPGEDGAESLRLVAVRHVPMGHRQHTVWGCRDRQQQAADSDPLAELIDVLQQRCTVTRRFAGAGYLPNVRSTPGMATADIDRPNRLFDQAARIDVRLPADAAAHPPAHAPRGGCGVLVWNRRRFVLIDARGPECLLEPWWHDADAHWRRRDYWRVQRADGQWLWVYRRGWDSPRDDEGDWFLHGAWT